MLGMLMDYRLASIFLRSRADRRELEVIKALMMVLLSSLAIMLALMYYYIDKPIDIFSISYSFKDYNDDNVLMLSSIASSSILICSFLLAFRYSSYKHKAIHIFGIAVTIITVSLFIMKSQFIVALYPIMLIISISSFIALLYHYLMLEDRLY